MSFEFLSLDNSKAEYAAVMESAASKKNFSPLDSKTSNSLGVGRGFLSSGLGFWLFNVFLFDEFLIDSYELMLRIVMHKTSHCILNKVRIINRFTIG